ncbi:Chemotaxis protein methyltransferase CheR [Lysobacter dokdonensis DS-58]|uniref:protein-glutamate methylesterase n=1 Tax=Lysobacter dokdonensis DS-58 TaxID=1300345 RepID=A0A0A2WIF3_9GAMM|nr:Chemotaxis protein methyltransferase CheR [Lysobacter dokdonensis DS-58]
MTPPPNETRPAKRRTPAASQEAHGEPPSHESHLPLIVGLGASAGGLEAFSTFFQHVRADENIAYVLVQHLSPDHTSILGELLQRHTLVPVQEATDGTAVQPGHIYVIPPDATLTIHEGLLQLSKPAPPRQYRWPIDSFFESLAEDQGENAVGIVLSGAGSDGARGLRAIKERGGLALAQASIDHVAMAGMPASAAATGMVDDVLPVDRMPARLVAHFEHLRLSRATKAPTARARTWPRTCTPSRACCAPTWATTSANTRKRRWFAASSGACRWRRPIRSRPTSPSCRAIRANSTTCSASC